MIRESFYELTGREVDLQEAEPAGGEDRDPAFGTLRRVAACRRVKTPVLRCRAVNRVGRSDVQVYIQD